MSGTRASFQSYSGIGQWGEENLHYSQTYRDGNLIEISGQGGWNPQKQTMEIPGNLVEEINQAFENVDLALRTAGGQGWSQVYRIRSYHAPLTGEAQEAMLRNMRKWMPDHKPIYTQLGISKLAVDGMRVEIEVWAKVC